jgi:hypothetical protein
MFYKRIDLRKLYEAADDLLLDGMPIDPTAAPKMSEPIDTMTQATPVASTDQVQSSTSTEEGPSVSDITNTKSGDERVNIAKGNTYALPLTQSEADELVKLANQGAGTEWKSSTPLKPLAGGRDGGPASMTLGQSEKPVYLSVKLVNNKSEQKALPLTLEGDDRYYVAWITTPDALLDNLDAATDITNSVKVAVKTPVVDKGGKNVEHSLQVWKDYEGGTSQMTSTDTSSDSSSTPQTMMDITGEEDTYTPQITDVEVDTDLAMQAPGTSAGFDATVESARAVSSFDEYLRRSR